MNRDGLTVMWGLVILIGVMIGLFVVTFVTWVAHTIETIGYLIGTTDVIGALS